jgi:hypothetical protein
LWIAAGANPQEVAARAGDATVRGPGAAPAGIGTDAPLDSTLERRADRLRWVVGVAGLEPAASSL